MTGDTLYAWQVQESDGAWSMVGALIPELGTHSPLVHRNPDMLARWKHLADLHARRTKQPLRLARFDLAEVVQ